MSELKTQPQKGSVDAYLAAIEDPQKRQDCRRICALMTELAGAKPQLWGDSIVGFGRYHYRYASGREGDWFLTGFAPRAQNISLYIMAGFSRYDDLMAKLGKHKTGKSCLYIKRLSDIDEAVLAELIQASLAYMDATYETSRIASA